MMRDSKGRFVAATNNNAKKENNNMKREEVLVANGINTGKYFSFTVNEAIPAGATITLSWDDVVAKEIEDAGYIKGKKLYRRFVMAQMFHNINIASKNNWTIDECIKRVYTWEYQFELMANEAFAMSKMEAEFDVESLTEREKFWSAENMIAIFEEHYAKFRHYVNNLSVINSKKYGPSKFVLGRYYKICELGNAYKKINEFIDEFKLCTTWSQRHKMLVMAKYVFVDFEKTDAKLKKWLDCFKGAGAYYTLVNMAMYHNVAVENYETKEKLKSNAAYEYLRSCLDKYYREGWRFVAMLNRTIGLNNFTFGRQ